MRYFYNRFFIMALVCIGLPLLIKEDAYFLTLFIFVGINAIMAVGLNLLQGYAGQISLGHAGFAMLGAYVSSLCAIKLNFSPFIAALLGIGFSMAVALVIGLPLLRLKGYYLAMATLAFGEIVYLLVVFFHSFTGGTSGLINIPGIPYFESEFTYSYLVGLVFFMGIILAENIANSKHGRALLALRESPVIAQSLGVNTTKLKAQAFVISAAYASVGGILYAHYVNFIQPGNFGLFVSISLVVMVILGGMGSVWGPALGALLLTILPEQLQIFREYDSLFYGLIIILIGVFMPMGIMGKITKILTRHKSST